ncbi:glycosyltransferase [Bifidobacterium pseudolongum subsp. globosum]|uniref:Glycosyltransferase n=1 Tax=Bifidobacterium pseudolongum subsp. globosum TaxID=1690 RepID=A0A4Q5BE30_9BIFI|nr:glycosyltransferase [Bifidobacterium pseudolongum subsp. globosum]RYQ08716.1 glycosyltransferase [Bifidobacterium pseudolongum subsp. globosum]RYQ12778.1 glycosyltransferase [Bifidobacterium pseudolongum subsp. globosum]RYQ15375.1 glycosyltransferase [Bifidobacterium pseudolongum subsp. globosum]RYQ67412.1 glycosyltransferase [Bifidobacterium pseudolongum subsp. globosum]
MDATAERSDMLHREGECMKRCAGMVTFNPDMARLQANLDAITPQVEEVFVFDNGSGNAQAVRELSKRYDGAVHVQGAGRNLGIAAGLNAVLQWAAARQYDAALLLDQDSVATSGMVDALAQLLTDDVELVCPFILDRNRMTEEEYRSQHLPAVEHLTRGASHSAITSGSLVSVPAALAVGGFDDALFIDYVDFDFNERLLLNGYRIVKDNAVYLLHEKGKSGHTGLKVPRRRSDGTVVWAPLFTLGYNPMRCYYQARNRVIYWKKYHKWTKLEGLVEIPPLMVLSLLEPRRFAKLRAYCKGIVDGMRMPVKEYRP